MKRKIAVLLALCLMLSMVLLSGCGSKSSASSSDDDSTIIINISDEAKEFEKNTLTKDGGDKVFLEKGNYDLVISYLSAYPRVQQSFPECEVINKLDCEEFNGSKVYTLTDADGDYENIVLYTHGGGWVFEIAQEHVELCDALASRLDAKVYMPLYPLAPEATSEATYAVIEGLYTELLKQDKDIYIMGDSAGGNITLGLMYAIKEKGLEAPEKMVLIAPCSDMTFTNKEIKTVEKNDPILASYGASVGAELWAGKDNLQNPKNSAVYADVSGYPDTMIFQGTRDILGPDNFILYQNMKDAGVDVTLVKGEGLWHVFPIYPTPERDLSVDLIEEFCND